MGCLPTDNSKRSLKMVSYPPGLPPENVRRWPGRYFMFAFPIFLPTHLQVEPARRPRERWFPKPALQPPLRAKEEVENLVTLPVPAIKRHTRPRPVGDRHRSPRGSIRSRVRAGQRHFVGNTAHNLHSVRFAHHPKYLLQGKPQAQLLGERAQFRLLLPGLKIDSIIEVLFQSYLE